MTDCWTVPVTCTCGSSRLEHLTGSHPELLGTRATAIARCNDCRRQWQITATLTPFSEKGRGRHDD